MYLGTINDTDITGPGMESRGIVLDKHSHVELSTCSIHDTWSSGIWARDGSSCVISKSFVSGCGGYGAIYCTNGANIKVIIFLQSGTQGNVFRLSSSLYLSHNLSLSLRDRYGADTIMYNHFPPHHHKLFKHLDVTHT